MKHASAHTLRLLESVLAGIREFTQLREPRPGAFYRKRDAFLHFHEDPTGLFADVKLEGRVFTRLQVSTAEQQAALVTAVRSVLARPGSQE